MTVSNKSFLEKTFGIKTDRLSVQDLDGLLDMIIETLDKAIDNVDQKIYNLQTEIFNIKNN